MNIALIDDQLIMRQIQKAQISALGHTVETFANVESFFDELVKHSNHYDIIITDRFFDRVDTIVDRFADACRFYGYQGRIALCSFSCVELMHTAKPRDYGVDLFIDKAAPNWPETLAALQ